ncbi:MAG: sulfatase-like hydrolase/transferase [Planctomycetota bacterium]|nr:MAG: sulfatase-like hydrolase/transferase [Planctomycetota bacterium]
MSRYYFVLMMLISFISPAKAAEQTNVVLIMTDDQGAWTLGCYGTPEARTPAGDKLAAEGVRLTNAFATTPVCSPSRATFFTGRIPSQHGIHDWIKHENIGPRARYCLPNEILLSEILARNGYTCGLSGKWHLGDSMNTHGGYTFWYALPTGGSKYNNAEMIWKDNKIQTTGYLTDRITDKAIEFIEANKGRPFFINVQYNAPHSPFNGHPEELVDLYRDCPFNSIPKLPLHPWAAALYQVLKKPELLWQYMAACSGVDRAVGRIVAALDKLGLSEKTLVIFTSDQGFAFGHHGICGKGNATNPRNAYDTVLRIPMIFRHTGRLEKGREVDALISVYDYVPTVLDYLDLGKSPGRNLPGRSFAPMLRGGQVEDWPDAVFGEYSHLRMIRTRDYKYIHRANGGPFELYDLKNDPDETKNLADAAEHQKLKKKLRQRMFKWFERYAEAGADPIGNEYLRPADR